MHAQDMKVIGIVQLKGGTGRSTLATNLAAMFSKKAHTTLVDADIPQGTSESWYTVRREENNTRGLSMATVDTAQALIKAAGALKTDYMIIDAPPRIAEVTRAILMLSDLLLIPLGTSAAEIWATADLLDTIEEARQQRPDLRYRIVWNKYRPYTRSAGEFRQAVSEDLTPDALENTLGLRIAYSEALARGLSVDEWKDPLARAEMRAITAEIEQLL